MGTVSESNGDRSGLGRAREHKNEGCGMSLLTPTQETIGESKTRSGLTLKVPDGVRILIVCEDDSDTERLKTILQKAGFVSECAKSITAGCEAAKSGRFQVVVSTPLLRDGSWRRLTDIANHYDLGFEVILWARTFDLAEWGEALKEGAFDVLDALCEVPRAVEAIKTALWAAYLKGAGPDPRATSPQEAA
jgi:DNA-binding NtrC family response regulator